MGSFEDLAADMRTAGMIHDDNMLYTIFLDALPSEYDIEFRNLASRDSVSREEIIKAVRERHHRLCGNRKKGSNPSDYAMYAGDAAGGGRGNSGSRGKGGCRWKGGGGPWGNQGRGGNYPRWGCYRCGKKGHVAADCRTKLCDR
ncbi:unnamed protein product [Laminaria digitata]